MEGSPKSELWCPKSKLDRNTDHLCNLLHPIPHKLQQSIQQFQLSTQMNIQQLESQMSQLASFVGRLESQGKFPSQPIVNPKQSASAILLRSGKELQEHMDENSTKRGHAQKRKPEKEVKIPQE
ncbi:UNVERIFIED_CONTAM: hypothetical protein Slati_1926000 [Sesamum latifolium]|uniref:Uncharacterized protein n=1 Tax=Sesamum latifolium TaxID=2727402 RepID=A0AAW2X351_9LAMI